MPHPLGTALYKAIKRRTSSGGGASSTAPSPAPKPRPSGRSVKRLLVNGAVFAVILTVILVIAKAVIGGIWGFFSGPSSSPASSTVQAVEIVNRGRWFAFIIAGTAMAVFGLPVVWRWWREAIIKNNDVKKTIITLGMALPSIHWMLWADWPVQWERFWNSPYFWPAHFAVLVTAYLANKKSDGTLYKVAWWIIIIAILRWGYTTWNDDVSNAWSWVKTKATPKPAKAEAAPAGAAWMKQGPYRDAVMEAFPDDTLMWSIASCESDFMQYRSTGDDSVVVRNPSSSAVGIFQIMESAHLEESYRLGMDIFTPEGNIAYAKVLREKNGYRDWEESKDCWGAKTGAWKQPRVTVGKQGIKAADAPDTDQDITPEADTVMVGPDGALTEVGNGITVMAPSGSAVATGQFVSGGNAEFIIGNAPLVIKPNVLSTIVVRSTGPEEVLIIITRR